MSRRCLIIHLLAVAVCAACEPEPVSPQMSFFVTSAGLQKGGDLGGLSGADAHCQRLATAAGSARTWRAHLSAPATAALPAVNARDRIGKGPWLNYGGVEIANSVETLYSGRNGISMRTALTEQGRRVSTTIHDMLTGTDGRGLLATRGANADTTCGGWTRSDSAGHAMLGHSDGGSVEAGSVPWTAAHMSSGCRPSDLEDTGGSGLFYCFAID